MWLDRPVLYWHACQETRLTRRQTSNQNASEQRPPLGVYVCSSSTRHPLAHTMFSHGLYGAYLRTAFYHQPDDCIRVWPSKGAGVCVCHSPVPPACLLSRCPVASPPCCWCAGWINCAPCASAWDDAQPKRSCRCCFRPPQASLLSRGWPCPPRRLASHLTIRPADKGCAAVYTCVQVKQKWSSGWRCPCKCCFLRCSLKHLGHSATVAQGRVVGNITS